MYFVLVFVQRGQTKTYEPNFREAIKHAEMVRSGKLPKSPGEGATEVPDRRRSRRWSLDVPVYVFTDAHERPEQGALSRRGAHASRECERSVVTAECPDTKGTKTASHQFTNTQQEQDCRVVFLGTKRSRTVEAGVEFPLTNPDFWQLSPAPKGEPAT